jgi:hypothetical protein
MKLTDLTAPPPPPVARKFSIELTEHELKTLAILMGNISEQNIRDQVRGSSGMSPKVIAERISHDIFFACEKLFNR